jgi:hypothetical protein
VLPFLNDAPNGLKPSFRLGVDPISTSGHKMIGKRAMAPVSATAAAGGGRRVLRQPPRHKEKGPVRAAHPREAFPVAATHGR